MVEQNDYYPFGTRHPNGLTQLSANRWRFSGKEEQDAAFGIAYSDFGARLYDRSAAWTAIDPLAEKYYSVSPYVYCNSNPVNLLDPIGQNPIYSNTGVFLGPDENGLTGDFIIMETSHFTQGMAHSDAEKNRFSGELENDVIESIKKHHGGLNQRPDYDGVITKQEADEWWLNGSGSPLFVDRSKINLPGVTTKSFRRKKSFYKNFIWSLSESGKTFGTLRLELTNPEDGEVSIGKEYLDEYDFKMHKGRPLRNIATLIGRPGKKDAGEDYKFYGYGKKTVPKKKNR